MMEMNGWCGILAAVLLSLIVATGAAGAGDVPGVPAGEDFGAGITLSEVSDFGDVVSDPAKYSDAPVLVRGTISDVCQRKGCWLVLSEGAHRVQIRFADYAFFVPKDSRGKQAYVEGRVKAETLSEEEARHYAAESIDGDPSAIRGPQEVVSFTATGVRIVSEQEP
jgi:hypothetical protein